MTDLILSEKYETYKRKKLDIKQINKNYKDSIQFQILEFHSGDEQIEEEGSEELQNLFRVNIFGVTELGHSVCLKVNDFEPYFYIKVDDSWKIDNKNKFVAELKRRLNKDKEYLDSDNCKLLKRKIFYGFRGHKLNKFIKLSFKSMKIYHYAKKIIQTNTFNITKKNQTFELFEHKIDINLKVINGLGVKSTGWIEFDYKKCEQDHSTKSQIEFITESQGITTLDRADIAPFRQMSYDIECFSHDLIKFPQANNPLDTITQIGTSFQMTGSDSIDLQYLMTLGECSPLLTKGAILKCCKTEKDILLGWSKMISDLDPDIIYGYNNHGFDDEYINTRVKLLGISFKFYSFSRMDNIKANFKENNFSSSAYGSYKDGFLNIPGRINFDLITYIKREFKLSSYKLDSVAEEFLTSKISNGFSRIPKEGDTKLFLEDSALQKIKLGYQLSIKDIYETQNLGRIKEIGKNFVITESPVSEIVLENSDILLDIKKNPVTPNMIFKSFADKNKDEMRDVADYCLQDTLLPVLLMNKLNILINLVQMALVTFVPLKYLHERGQQVKCLSQILQLTRANDYIIPFVEPVKEAFEGAIVLDPPKKAYFSPVVVLDFSSMYPNSIRRFNICYSSIVLDPQFDNLEGFEYKDFEWTDKTTKEHFKYRYVQNNDSIIPQLVSNLINSRKEVREKMKIEKDPFKLMIMNALQNSLKVSCNSQYGFFSAQSLCLTALASTTTAIGRSLIMETKDFITEKYKDFDVVYGDSVTGDTVINIKKDEKVDVKEIQNIVEECEWKPYDIQFKDLINDVSKEQAIVPDTFIWSGQGWTKVVKIIRHKTKKRIFMIKTAKGIIKITEDHSLLTNNKIPIAPKDCKIGTKLWHKSIE